MWGRHKEKTSRRRQLKGPGKGSPELDRQSDTSVQEAEKREKERTPSTFIRVSLVQLTTRSDLQQSNCISQLMRSSGFCFQRPYEKKRITQIETCKYHDLFAPRRSTSSSVLNLAPSFSVIYLHGFAPAPINMAEYFRSMTRTDHLNHAKIRASSIRNRVMLQLQQHQLSGFFFV